MNEDANYWRHGSRGAGGKLRRVKATDGEVSNNSSDSPWIPRSPSCHLSQRVRFLARPSSSPPSCCKETQSGSTRFNPLRFSNQTTGSDRSESRGYRTRPKDPSGICSRMLAIPRRTGLCPPSGLRMTSTPRLALPRASDQQTGTPFNKGRVSLTLQKIVPADIADFRAAQPRAGLKEIPLEALEAAILVETVRNGHPVSTTCPATITPQANGSYALVTDAIIGVNILALFQTSRRPGLQDASSQRDFEPGASSQNRRSCRAVQHDGSPA
jgi:hypothetical protein